MDGSGNGLEIDTRIWQEHPRRYVTADLELPDFPPTLAVSADGQLAVPVPWKQTVAIYTAEGELLRELGGRGEGIGQFQRLSMVGWLGDTLWVADQVSFRVTFFCPPDYEARAQEDPSGSLRSKRMRVPLPTAAGGWFSVRRTRNPPSDEAPEDEWVVIDPEWRATTSVLRLAPRPPRVEFRITDSTAVSVEVQPFGFHRLYTFSPDGGSVTLADRDRGLNGNGSWSYTLTRLTVDGDTVFRTVRSVDPVPLDEETRQVMIEHYVSLPVIQRSGLDVLTMRQKVAESVWFPECHPPVTDVAVGVDGWTWVRREDRWQGAVLWDTFDPSGRFDSTWELDRDIRHPTSFADGVWAAVREGGAVRLVRFSRNPPESVR